MTEGREMSEMNIYQRINKVMKSVAYVKKDSAITGAGGGYKAVSHDQVVSAARQALVEAGVMIFPNQLSGEFLIKRDLNLPTPVKMGLYTGTYQINFVGIDAGDMISVTVQAHANDNGDKAPGKALTYATKSAILKVLCLETGENDESREEVMDKSNTLDQQQYNELAGHCLIQGEGGLQWTDTGQKLAAAYGIQSLEALPKSKFAAALERCEKAAS